MIIDLKSIFINDNSSLPIEYGLDMSTVDYAGVFPLKSPVKAKGSITNKASLVVLDLKITYDFDAPCDRCGIPSVKKYTISVNKSLAASIEGEDSDSIILVPGMEFDLDEFIYAEVIPSLPMKHLCKADCKGICQKCGKDLNQGDCDCPKKEIDPRLAALADLLN